MTESFLRQRRNLFIVNAIFLFSYYAEVNVKKFTLAGISFDSFGNPEAIYYFLWVVFLYFGYRFFLFFVEDEMSNFILNWQGLMSTYVDKELEKVANDYCGEGLNKQSVSGYYMAKKNNWVINFERELRDSEETVGGIPISHDSITVSKLRILFPQLRAIFKFCFLTSALTNYVLPVALSVYVAIVVGFSSWDGAFLNLFNN